MKKLFAALSACLLSLCLLVSCGSKIGAVKKTFDKAGYASAEETIENSDSVIKSMVTFKKGTIIDFDYGIVIELGSTDDLETAIEEMKKDEDLKAFAGLFADDAKKVAENLKKSDLVNGNCVFFGTPKAIETFKSSK